MFIIYLFIYNYDNVHETNMLCYVYFTLKCFIDNAFAMYYYYSCKLFH